eukprot:2006726-Rhodomonas_salina.1
MHIPSFVDTAAPGSGFRVQGLACGPDVRRLSRCSDHSNFATLTSLIGLIVILMAEQSWENAARNRRCRDGVDGCGNSTRKHG